MTNEYVIYSNNRRFVIVPEIEAAFKNEPFGFFWGEVTHNDLPKLLDFFYTHLNIPSLFTSSSDVATALEQLMVNFRVVDAAGGVVVNSAGKVLMIFRNNLWDLPKGKVEENEPVDIAAIREVEEETGLKDVQITSPLCQTYHTYLLNGNRMLKRTYWFLMEAPDNQNLVPQVEEGIDRVVWLGKQELSSKLNRSFDSIRQVINRYSKMAEGESAYG